MKLKEVKNLFIIDYGYNGEGIAKENEFVIFIPYSKKNCYVKCEISEIKKNLVTARNIAPERGVCPYFNTCGGCSIQHLPYNEQLAFKQEKIKNNLKKICKVQMSINSVLESPDVFYYRNKITYAIDNLKIGLKKLKSHEIIEVASCPIFKSKIDFLSPFRQYLAKYQDSAINYFQILTLNEKYILTFVTNKDLKNEKALIELMNSCGVPIGIYLNYSTHSNQILSPEFKHIYGLTEIEYNGLNVNSGTFLQVNSSMENLLYHKTISLISSNEIVLNAYSGAGYLSALIAPKAKKVIGIEINPMAHQIAQELKVRNNITNLENICGNANTLKALYPFDTIVIDPPANGIDSETLDAISKSNAKKIIYISCNSATLARDLNKLLNLYAIKEIQPFDMFPQTSEVETLVYLEKI